MSQRLPQFDWKIVKQRKDSLPLVDRLDNVCFDISDALAVADFIWHKQANDLKE